MCPAAQPRLPLPRRGVAAFVACLVVVLVGGASARAFAQRLPIRVYNTVDGLASDRIARIVRDPRGFVWFCSANGVSRFDGERFTTYGPETGLPHPSINDLLITRAGHYLLASNGGGAIVLDVAPHGSDTASGPGAATGRDAGAAASAPPDAQRMARAPRDAWRFRSHRVGDQAATNRLNALIEDRHGRIWAGTDAGLFMIERWQEPLRFTRVAIGGATPDASTQVWAFAEGRDGSLWIGANVGLSRRLPDGRIVHYTWPTFSDRVLALVEDRAGRVWVGHDQGLSVFMPDDVGSIASTASTTSTTPTTSTVSTTSTTTSAASATSTRSATATISTASETPVATPGVRRLIERAKQGASKDLAADASPALPDTPGEVVSWTAGASGIPAAVTALALAGDGHVWLAGLDRLVEFDGRQFQSSRMPVGGVGAGPSPLIEDADGHIWVGTLVDGALRFAPRGLMTFTEAEGTRGTFVNTFQTRDGRRCAYTADAVVSCYDGRRFVVVGTPAAASDGWLVGARVILEDRARQWWVATRRGLHRFPPGTRIADLPRARPQQTYAAGNGFAADSVAELYEDARGDIWIATLTTSRHPLARWERTTGRLVTYSDADGLPPFYRPLSFAEDRAGALWIGFREGGVVRYHGGRFERMREGDHVPTGDWVSVHVDRSGRLWVATVGGGVYRVDRPDQRPLRVARYTMADGLATDQVLSLTEDARGRIYLGTTQGLDRLDPATGHIRRYTRADGLSSSEVAWEAFHDRGGTLWFRSGGGLSRLVPTPDRPTRAPHVRIDRALVADAPRPLSALGESNVALGTIPGAGPVQIEFAGPSFETGGALRYQHKLEGADTDWSAPTRERSVRFARLAAGQYQFLVRAINAQGIPSTQPATVTFRVLPPIWLRWWFLALATAAALLVAYAAHRYRVAQILSLERIRGRIATDLHDEVGSSLSQIAVLSEVARRQVEAIDTRLAEPLARIADVSRESVGAMSVIVWAVDPQRDAVIELEQRMRRFANDVLATRDIIVRFPASTTASGLSADADIRHDVFLVFKEAINNIVRHANATHVQIDFQVRHHTIALAVRDNGRGFNGIDPSRGLGLRSMRERARRLRGQLNITSERGAGTRVFLTVPLTRRASAGWWPRRAM